MSALNQIMMAVAAISATPSGQAAYTTPGTYSWTVPAGVTSVCVVCVGAGAAGTVYLADSQGAPSGAGGGLAYGNAIPVTPGENITVRVGAAGQASFFRDSSTLQGGGGTGTTGGTSTGTARTGGGIGGAGRPSGYIGNAGGGAGGYAGNGGIGGGSGGAATNGSGGGGGGGGSGAYDPPTIYRGGDGGGVGILGQGTNGAAGSTAASSPGGPGSPGSGGVGKSYGAGGSGGTPGSGSAGTPGTGAVRIIWGVGRSFPSTNTGDV